MTGAAAASSAWPCRFSLGSQVPWSDLGGLTSVGPHGHDDVGAWHWQPGAVASEQVVHSAEMGIPPWAEGLDREEHFASPEGCRTVSQALASQRERTSTFPSSRS